MIYNALKLITTLFFTLFILFSIVEIAVRIFAPQGGRSFIADPFIRTIHPKNVIETRKREGVEATSKTNSQGFVGNDFVVEKPPDTYRIAIIGDSFTEAFDVGIENSFAHLLEKNLNERFESTSFEVYNFGVSGAGATHELLAYEHYAKKYDPDIVVWQMYLGNDISDDLLLGQEVNGEATSPSEKEARTGRIRAFMSNNLQSPRFFIRKLEKIKAIYTLLARYKIVSRSQHYYDKPDAYPFIYDIFNIGEKTIFTDNFSLPCQFSERFQKTTSQDGISLLVLLIPSKYQVIDEDWEKLLLKFPSMQNKTWDRLQPLRPLKKCLDAQNITYIDILPIFQDNIKDGGARMYYATDDHFNPLGHQLTAVALEEKILGDEGGSYSVQSE